MIHSTDFIFTVLNLISLYLNLFPTFITFLYLILSYLINFFQIFYRTIFYVLVNYYFIIFSYFFTMIIIFHYFTVLCEEINVGESVVRTIASGIRPHYAAEDLVNRKVCVLANLKDRNLAGFKSQVRASNSSL